MLSGGDSIRVVQPLFPVEGEGAIPISPLQLHVDFIGKEKFRELNRKWHSRLPKCKNCFEGICFGAHYKNVFYATAWWSKPVARAFNGKNFFELRRMAIASDAPKNTASRFLRIMTVIIKTERPEIKKLISYQDTDVHTGTIYKASGWVIEHEGERIDENCGYNNWKTRLGRINQSLAPKVRWAKDIK